MTTLLAERPMTRRNDMPVKMDAEVVRKAKIVAAYRNQSLAEFLSDELGAIVDQLLKDEHEKEVGGVTQKAPKPKGKGAR